jgi:arylsulfatase A-like enzyme
VWQETVQVPLILRLPGGKHAGEVITTPVSQVDVAPTVWGQLDLTPLAGDGRDLSVGLGEGSLPLEPVFSEATKPGEPPEQGWYNSLRPRAVRLGQWKLHFEPATGRSRLYDLASDPDERSDVSDDYPQRVAELLEALRIWGEQADPLPTTPVSSATALQQLKQLGYLQ